ncbi:MAG: Uma2 family endonuclease [Actinobacteria bacterium]|nr:Uma2 family endonuclease [Actinomycetota bacterium]
MADVVSDSATPAHQRVVLELAVRLRSYEDAHVGQTGLSPLDVALGDHTLQPDVFWVPTDERIEHPVRVTPSFVVEVSSPSTRRHDLVRKRRVYEQAGVAEYWFVDLDANRIERYSLGPDGSYGHPDLVSGGASIASTALGAFEVAVDDLLPY